MHTRLRGHPTQAVHAPLVHITLRGVNIIDTQFLASAVFDKLLKAGCEARSDERATHTSENTRKLGDA